MYFFPLIVVTPPAIESLLFVPLLIAHVQTPVSGQ
jgi:hypothetical protein